MYVVIFLRINEKAFLQSKVIFLGKISSLFFFSQIQRSGEEGILILINSNTVVKKEGKILENYYIKIKEKGWFH